MKVLRNENGVRGCLFFALCFLSAMSFTRPSFARSEAVHTADKFIEGNRKFVPSIEVLNEVVATVLGTDKNKVQDWLTPMALFEAQNLVYQLIVSQMQPNANQKEILVNFFRLHRAAFFLAGGVSAVGYFLDTENVLKLVSFGTSAFAYWKYHQWRSTWRNAALLPN